MKKARLSAIIITRNASSMIVDCLHSLSWVDEIIVLDDASKDNTRQIASNFGAKVYSTVRWEGFGKQRQYAQKYATGDYILMIDADERITPQLEVSIKNIMINRPQENIVYQINRRNMFLDHCVRHGTWYPDRVIRLYAKNLYRYNNDLVHESLDCSGAPIVTLEGVLLHLTADDYFIFQQKQLIYAKQWAKQQYLAGKNSCLISAIAHSSYAFFKSLLLRAGILDGKIGLILAYINAQYTFNKYVGLWAMKKNR